MLPGACAMADAVEREPSGMAALLGTTGEKAEEVAATRRAAGGRLWVANLNAPGQVVLAGAIEDIDWLVGNARRLGLRRAVKLNVAGAFHSPMMAAAVPPLEAALDQVTLKDPSFPVWANTTGTRFAVGDTAWAPRPTGSLSGTVQCLAGFDVRFRRRRVRPRRAGRRDGRAGQAGDPRM